MIERANHISFWTSSMILWQVRLEERVKVIEKFVKIAEVKKKEIETYHRLESETSK